MLHLVEPPGQRIHSARKIVDHREQFILSFVEKEVLLFQTSYRVHPFRSFRLFIVHGGFLEARLRFTRSDPYRKFISASVLPRLRVGTLGPA